MRGRGMIGMTLVIAVISVVACREQVAVEPPQNGGAERGGDLLQAVVAAQQDLEHVQGRFEQSTVQADDPEAAPNVYRVGFAFSLPHRYFLLYQPEIDPEEKEWFISDGEHQWHAEQLFADDPPIVDRKPVEAGSWGFHRVIDFFRMDLEGLREDFTMEAHAVEEPAVAGATVAIDLSPKRDELAEEIRGIRVLVGEDYRTRGVVITDAKDNVITIEVLEADYQSEPDDELFTWPE